MGLPAHHGPNGRTPDECPELLYRLGPVLNPAVLRLLHRSPQAIRHLSWEPHSLIRQL